MYYKAIEKFTGVTDLSDQYIIQDIFINRTMFSIIVNVSGQELQYQRPTNKYSFLLAINPSVSVIITRHESDNDLYVKWLI